MDKVLSRVFDIHDCHTPSLLHLAIIRPNALDCTLKSKDLVSVVHSAPGLAVAMLRRSETVLELLLTEVMHQS
jgi:hypothetical protein